MTLYLVRHAKAGNRSEWQGDDWLRPLTTPGQAQARALLAQFHAARFGAVLASPYVRCMETVVPIASAHGLPVVPTDALAEGADLDATMALLASHVEHGAIFCSHGDVIPMVLEHLAARGTDLGPAPRCEKGSTWVLDGEFDGAITARYLPPPTSGR